MNPFLRASLAAFFGFALLGLSSLPAHAGELGSSDDSRFAWLGRRVSDSDYAFWLCGVEYAVPTGFGITSKFIHQFHEADRNSRTHPYLAVTLKTGADGVRLALGYGAMRTGASVFSGGEVRAAVLRTWRSPTKTDAGKTLVGPEVRTMLFSFLSVGAGYYWEISPKGPSRDAFLGVQVGLGF